MSKPYGMTAAFQIVRPTQAENAIYDCVQTCIACNMTPEQFIREARECWGLVLDETKKQADNEFKAAVQR